MMNPNPKTVDPGITEPGNISRHVQGDFAAKNEDIGREYEFTDILKGEDKEDDIESFMSHSVDVFDDNISIEELSRNAKEEQTPKTNNLSNENASLRNSATSLKSSLRGPVKREYSKGKRGSMRVKSASNRVIIDLGADDDNPTAEKRQLFASMKSNRTSKNNFLVDIDVDVDGEGGTAPMFDLSGLGSKQFSSANIMSDDDSNFENRMGRWTKNRKQGMRRISVFRRKTDIKENNAAVWEFQNFFEYFLYTGLALVIHLAAGLPPIFFPDSHDGSGTHIIDPSITSCTKKNATSSELNNEAMCDITVSGESDSQLPKYLPSLTLSPQQVVLGGAEKFRFLAAFILGGFVLNTVKIWCDRRMRYRALNGKIRTLLVTLFSLLPVSKVDHQLMYERTVIARWIILGYELAVLEARGQMDTEDGLDYLEALNLLRDNEWELMTDGDRMTTVWTWINAKAKKLQKDGYIDSNDMITITQSICEVRNNGMNLVADLYEDNPTPYVYICALLVNVNLLTQSISDGLQWGIWLNDTNGRVWLQPKMYIAIFIQFSYNAIFAMLFDLCAALHNPYGPRDFLDLPHHTVGAQVRRLAKDMAQGDQPFAMTKEVTNASGIAIVVGDEEEKQRDAMRKMDTRLASLGDKIKTSIFSPKSSDKMAKKKAESAAKARLRHVAKQIISEKSEKKDFASMAMMALSKSKQGE